MSAPSSKKQVVTLTIMTLVLAAVVVMVIPRLPLPLRFTAATADMLAAAIIFVALRQQDRK